MAKAAPPRQKSAVVQKAKIRFSSENEGVSIPVVWEEVANKKSGIVQTQFQLELDLAPAPLRKFAADGYSVLVRGGTAHFVFIQSKLVGGEPRAMLDVQMPLGLLPNVISTLRTLDSEIGAAPTIFDKEADQTVTMVCNFMRAVGTPELGCLDFYFASPNSVRAISNNSTIHIQAEVRVVSSSLVFVGFLKAMQNMDVSGCVTLGQSDGLS